MKHICDVTAEGLPETAFFETLPEDRCPVHEALLIAGQGRALSCGRGTYCRDGVAQLALILDDITRNKARDGDLGLILELCKNISLASDCAPAVRVSALIASSAELHRGVWDDHLLRKKCPALICPGYVTVLILPDKCTGCGACVPCCPERAITGKEGYIHVVDTERCTRCGACFAACPEKAFTKAGALKPRVPEAPVPVGAFSTEQPRRRRRRGE
jgi:NADH-quinone oxidoreductase subunit F